MQRLLATCVALLVLIAPNFARAATRDLLVLNTGDQAIFSLQIGHAASGTWSDDLLPFNDVIDVSAAKTVHVPFDTGSCFYDVRAKFADGAVSILPLVDFCSVDRLTVGLP